MKQIIAKKEPVIKPELNMDVFHDSIYGGKELMKVVGIRDKQVELRGDYSGGTNNIIENSWLPIDGTFRIRKVCAEQLNSPNGCQLHNIHWGFPKCEPYLSNWGHYVEGKLTDVVVIQ